METPGDVARSRNHSMGLAHEPQPIRVLIADDSAVMRTTLAHMLEASPLIRVCGTARNGQEVVEKTKLLQPDVITLDVEMPLLNGVEALKRIMSECPCPVIMFSSATREGAEVTLEALSAGAFDYLPKVSFKPCANTLKLQRDLIEKIEAASHSWFARKALHRPSLPPPVLRIHSRETPQPIPRIVVLGTSTGGPQALQGLLSKLPGDLPLAMIVVQHMPPGFTAPLAKRLDGLSKLKVCEAQHGEAVLPGTVYIAPAGQHTTLAKSAHRVSICLSDAPSNTAHKPSVDVTMLSVAEVFGHYALGIILTGMGSDGVQGMTAIHEAGGLTMGQDEASSVVYGMPRCCAERGILQHVVPLSEIPRHILQAIHYRALI
jgi:two-component system, chemotaxis family, protein-glutamate methylesterase/glutaminase